MDPGGRSYDCLGKHKRQNTLKILHSLNAHVLKLINEVRNVKCCLPKQNSYNFLTL